MIVLPLLLLPLLLVASFFQTPFALALLTLSAGLVAHLLRASWPLLSRLRGASRSEPAAHRSWVSRWAALCGRAVYGEL